MRENRASDPGRALRDAFASSSRVYHHSDTQPLVVCKTWNRGMGRGPLVAFLARDRCICINTGLWNAHDERKLQAFLCRQGIAEGWTVVRGHYNLWGRHAFGPHALTGARAECIRRTPVINQNHTL